MTIKQYMEQQLQSMGLWQQEAEAVMTQMESEECASDMKGRWDDQCDGYPPVLLDVALLTVKSVAAKWLAVNKPKHWARAMFSA